MSSIQQALVRAVQSGLMLVRGAMPGFVMKRLAGRASAIVSAIATPIGQSFDKRPIALPDWTPLFPKSAFAGGPVILANTALAWGGAERQLVTTMKGLAEREIKSSLLCLRLHEDENLDFFVSALAGVPGFVRNAMSSTEGQAALATTPGAFDRFKTAIAWLPFDVQADVLRFAGEFATLKPAVVHAWQDATSIAAGYAAWMVGVPRIVLSARSVAPVSFHYLRPYMADAYRELAACASIVMLNNSEAGAHDYIRWLGVGEDRVVVLRNGLDPAAVRRPAANELAALRDRLGIPTGAPVIGTVIRFSPVKQPLLWIQAAALVSRARPDCHFVIFGTGPMRDDVIAVAKREGFADRLHCPGTIENAVLGLSLFDVFLLTSQVEGTPNVVLEASLLGIFVIATAVGGTGETIVSGVTGEAVSDATAPKLAQAVLAALSDPAAMHRASIEGPTFVQKRFGLSRMLDETLSIYHLKPR